MEKFLQITCFFVNNQAREKADEFSISLFDYYLEPF